MKVLTLWMATQPVLMIQEPSKMKHYLVSVEQWVSRISAADICRSYGGNLINLEASQTDVFLHQLEGHLISMGYKSKRFFTGLSHVGDRFVWDDNCMLASKAMVQQATGDTSDYDVTKSNKYYQLFFNRRNDGGSAEVFMGRWCPAECERNYICEFETNAPCETQPHSEVAVTGLTQMTLKMEGDQCRQACFETVTDEGECWFYRFDHEVCYMWLSDSQPNDNVLTQQQNGFVIYSKNCVALVVEKEFSRGRHIEDDQLCANHDVTSEPVSNLQPTDIVRSPLDIINFLQTDPTINPIVNVLEPSNPFTLGVGESAVTSEGSTSHPTLTRLRQFTFDEETPVHVPTDPGFIFITEVLTDTIVWPTSVIIEAPFIQSPDEQPVMKDSPATKSRSDGSESTRHCICRTDVNQTQEKKEQFTEELVANLTIDVKKTSANRRKYKSAEDPRPSARNIGSFGAVILGLVFGGLVLSDLPTLVRFIYNLVKKIRGRGKVQKIHIPPPACESLK